MTSPGLAPNRLLEPRIPPGLSVKVFGLGGVGGPVARYLAVFLAALINQNVEIAISQFIGDK